jgi:hypothetical protein
VSEPATTRAVQPILERPPPATAASTHGATRSTTVQALAIQMVMVSLGFVSGAALARELGPADRGVYQEVVLVYALAGPVLGLGLGSALTSRRSSSPPPVQHLVVLQAVAWGLGAFSWRCWCRCPRVVIAICLLLPGCVISPLTEAACTDGVGPQTYNALGSLTSGGPASPWWCWRRPVS